ncbi:hypothetical protein [Flavobacterium sp.]|uniref:hypothetical protein n=1 Tax=Flavobacterium sp. TaxID=239 RepID=UPI002ED7FC67
MKKTISTIFCLAALSLVTLTTSCSSDDPKTETPTSDFVVVRDNLQGEIKSGEVVLESGTYKLTGKLVVNSSAKLTIKAGVIIEATELDKTKLESIRYIAIAQGGQIDVQGTAASPVVMTATVKTPAAWGGLVICGKAPINKSLTGAQAEVSDLAYGGTDAADNSGSIKYLRIEYPGYSYTPEKEFNGLSLFGVGNKTVIDYVQIFESSDDGFEWFGGTVNASHLVVSNKDANTVGDDLFDWTEGWNGNGDSWYGIRTNGGNRGIEADNNANNHLATPISFPNIKNLTLIGGTSIGGESQGMKLRVGTKGKFDNVVLKGWATGFDVQHDETLSYVGADLLATNVKFEDVTLKVKGTATTATGTVPDMTKLFTESASATGAGNGSGVPTWAAGWTKGL